MPFVVGTAIQVKYFIGVTGLTVNARIEDESGGVFGAELTLVENAVFVAAGHVGLYETTFTPDAAGTWAAIIYYGGVRVGQVYYDVLVSVVGELEVLPVSITDPANNGVTTVATVTTQPCVIEKIIIHADAIQTVDMTSCAVEGGVGQVVTFLGVGDAIRANLDAADKQVSWNGAVRLDAGKLITIDLQGTGATAVDLTIIILYRPEVAGGVLA